MFSSIRLKLFAAFGSLLALIAVLSVVNWKNCDKIFAHAHLLHEQDFRAERTTSNLSLALVQVQQWLSDISATRAAPGFDDGFDMAAENAETFRSLLDELGSIESVDADLGEIRVAFDAFYSKGVEMAQAYIDGGPESGNQAMSEFDAYATRILELTEALEEEYVGRAGESIAEVVGSTEAMQDRLVSTGVQILVVMVVLGWLLTRSITRPLHACRDVAVAVAQGDLSRRADVKAKDETGVLARALNEAVERTQTAMSEVESTREQVQADWRVLSEKVDTMRGVIRAAADGDLTGSVTFSGNDAIGTMADSLGAFLNDLRGRIGTVRSNSDRLTQASSRLSSASAGLSTQAQDAASSAESGRASIEQVNEGLMTVAGAMEQVTSSVREISHQTHTAVGIGQEAVHRSETARSVIEQLSAKGDEIQAIVDVINRIAEQTNLLALNATIEAASAGDAGRGFAVVASEVKDLARDTSAATDEVRSRIEAIRDFASQADAATVSIEEIVREITDAQHTIAAAVEEQNATVNEIAASIQIAADGSSRAMDSMNMLAEAAEKTRSEAGDFSLAAVECFEMAEGLTGLVNRFRCEP